MKRVISTRNLSKSIPFLFVLCYFIFSASSCNKEISVTPPDAPPPNGYLFVDSNPKGFYIYVDNKERRRITPDSLTWLNTGTYLITLKKNLFKDTSITINVVEGEKHSAFVDFTQNPSMKGKINCISNPPNAEIFINDSASGQVTPYTFNILPGQYYVKYRFQNHRDAEVQTSVSSGGTANVKLALVDTTLWTDYTVSNSKIPSNNLSCIAIGPRDIIYAGTNDLGFFSFEGSPNELIPYHSAFTNTVDCMIFNNNGALYTGTTNSVIYLFGAILIEYGPTNSSLPNYHVNAIAIDNTEGTCYIGTDKGITIEKGWVDFSPPVVDGEKSVIAKITALTIDTKGNLWAGVNNYGIAENTSSSKWTFYSSSKGSLISNNITALASSPSGEIWAGFDRTSASANGLSYFDGSAWSKVYPIPPTCKTNSIFIDRNNVKWIATDQGLIMFSSPSDATTFNYDNTGLDITDVKGVSQDSKGNIWIATSSGLYKYKGKH